MNGGLLRVTRAEASEPGWPLCVTSDSGHSKFHVLREPGLSDSESGHGVTASSQLGPAWLWGQRPCQSQLINLDRRPCLR